MSIANIPNAEELLNKIAQIMGAKVVTWENVNDAIDRDIF